jgi:hypothetical protein
VITYDNNEFISIDNFDFKSKGPFKTIAQIPEICWKLYTAMQADHIHLRCPEM